MIVCHQARYFSQLLSNGRELLFSLNDDVKSEQSLILYSVIGYFIYAHVLYFLHACLFHLNRFLGVV